MNTFKIAILSLLFVSATVSAQTYRGNNDRPFQNVQNSQAPKEPTAQEIESNRIQNIDKYLAKMKEALNLDELQTIAIKNELISNSKNVDIVMKKGDSQEDKSTEVKALIEKMDITINSYLSKEQKEQYLIFKANRKNGKKDKKDKKTQGKAEQSEAKDKTTEE